MARTRLSLTPIIPKHVPNSKEYRQAIEAAVKRVANLTERDYKSTVATWDHTVRFEQQISTRGGEYAIDVFTDDDVYGYVDEGTRPHVIRPKRARALRFSSGYRAKGRTGVIGSRQGGAFGAAVFAQEVQHPGFRGRKFTDAIRKRRQKTMEQEVSQSMAKVARKAK